MSHDTSTVTVGFKLSQNQASTDCSYRAYREKGERLRRLEVLVMEKGSMTLEAMVGFFDAV